ncbi:uro-adherence factor A [Amia ocellicauda]|uniref:uro-adherence factor A n=1 Tax=Amia ocellicauda TaxID=2972642 RepID=UPI003464D843
MSSLFTHEVMERTGSTGDPHRNDEVKEGGAYKETFEEDVSGGDAEDTDEDSDSQEQPGSVLWEKSFEQSIFLDIEDDDSFHLSDLQDSFCFRLSQDSSRESSLNLNGEDNCIYMYLNMEFNNIIISYEKINLLHDEDNIEQLGAYEAIQDEETFSKNSVDSGKEKIEEVPTKSSVTRVSEQRYNTMEDLPVQRCNIPGDTSDEDQEDLPYDGDLHDNDKYTVGERNSDINEQTVIPSVSGEKLSVQPAARNTFETTNIPNSTPSLPVLERGTEENEIENHSSEDIVGSYLTSVNLKDGRTHLQLRNDTKVGDTLEIGDQETPRSRITEVLLRHFSEEDFNSLSKDIEAETMPETSFTESVDETVLNKSDLQKSNHMSQQSNEGCSENGLEENVTTEPNKETEHAIWNETEESSTTELQKSTDTLGAESSLAASNDEHESERWSRPESPGLQDYEDTQRSVLGRAWSCNELKYGQGQVHYPLPDFSKVAPKIRIPKGNSAGRTGQTCGIVRIKSSPGLLSKSPAPTSVETIRKVLDTIQTPDTTFVLTDQQRRPDDPRQSPELVQHLQDEYDKLLTKYAEAENLIDQMRLGATTSTDSSKPNDFLELVTPDPGDFTAYTAGPPSVAHLTSTPRLSRPTLTGNGKVGKGAELLDSNTEETGLQGPSEGDKLTAELKEMIIQFTRKVEEFRNCLNSMSLGIKEQQEIFKSLVDAQDKLERSYMAKKEEHRALELRKYMGMSKNIGEFDPERQVEGEIFRIGMGLEDIKEQIDENVCSQLSPQISFTSPAPLPFADSIFSSNTSLHEETVPCVSPTVQEMAARDLGLDDSEESDLIQGTDLNPRATHPHSKRLDNSSHGYCGEGSAVVSESVALTSHEDDNYSLSEGKQRIVTPETDSGVGSLEPSRAATSLRQSQTAEYRRRLSSDQQSAPITMSRLCSSDSEASCSDVQTAISQDALSKGQRNARRQANLSGGSTASCWTHSVVSENNSTGQHENDLHNSSLINQSSDDHLLLPRPRDLTSPGTTLRNTSTAEKHSHLCAYTNDAIVALQLEVSRLKKELEESLLRLPQITERMDVNNTKNKPDKRYKSRSQPRSKVAPRRQVLYCCICYSLCCSFDSRGWKHVGSRNRRLLPRNKDSNHFKTEDWISSDLEARTDSEDFLQSFPGSESHPVPHRADSMKYSQHSSSEDREASYVVNRLSKGSEPQSKTAEDMDCVNGTEKSFPHCKRNLNKTFSQFNNGSSCSLPVSFEAMRPLSAEHHRRQSTQSDSALLPGQICQRRPEARAHINTKTGSSRKYKGENINTTLDRAIEAAQDMKRTTDRMAKTLSADLAKAELYRKMYGLYPMSSRMNTDSKCMKY